MKYIENVINEDVVHRKVTQEYDIYGIKRIRTITHNYFLRILILKTMYRNLTQKRYTNNII